MTRAVLFLAVLAGALPACTIGAFAPWATVEGRPILWKNRDVSNADQEVRHYTDAKYRYTTNVYAGEHSKAWAGINERGFAIMNSDAHNIGGRDQLDDGVVMKLALGNCATVDEFEALMDSLNEVGREKAGNFGVFDSTGATAIFEAANTFYTRYDADSAGLLIRANYAYSGDSNRLTGHNRHERAWELVRRETAERKISVPFIVRTLARDIGQVGFEPYPLPWQDRLGGLPFGFLPTDTTIGRTATRSVEVMVGPRPGEPASRGMMWYLPGSPFASSPVPLWVQGGATPELLDGPSTARLCDEARNLDRYERSASGYPALINTFTLRLVLDFFGPFEERVFARVESLEAEWGEQGPDSAAAAEMTARCAEELYDQYALFWRQFDWSARTAPPEQAGQSLATVTRGRLTVLVPPGASRLAAYDVQGRVVLRAGVAGGERVELDVTSLAPGGYYIIFDEGPEDGRLRFVRIRE